MDKARVIEEIETYLRESLEEGGESGDPDELRRLLLVYRFLPRRHYEPGEVIVASALVELELGNARAFYFIAPQGGGLVTRVDGHPVQVITPNSPLGEALMGKKAGDLVRVELRGGVREYRVLSVV